MYKTKDGRVHDSEAQAKEHLLDLCRELIDKNLMPITKGSPWFRRGHIVEIINFLTKDFEEFEKLVRQISKRMEM